MLRKQRLATCCAAALAAWAAPVVAQTTNEVQKVKDIASTGSLPLATPKQQSDAFDAAEAALKDYDYGKPESASAIFDTLTCETTKAPAARRAFVARLVALATNPEYSVAARELTLRRIPYVANERDVAKLFPLLTDKDENIAEMTRYALGPIPGASVNKAFRDAAAASTDETRIAGLLNVLGTRRDKEAVKFIGGYTGNSSPVVASAAIYALGKIGTKESAAVLRKLFTADADLKGLVGNALADNAAALAATGNRGDARAIYESLLKEEGAEGFRLAAFVGHANLSPNPSDVALKALLGEDAALQSAAATLLTTTKDSALNRKLAATIKGKKPETQVALLGIASSRQAKEAIAPARDLLASETTETRSAAITTLGKIGDKSVLSDLLKVAATKGDEFADQARASIDQLAGPGIDELLIEIITPGRNAAADNAEIDQAMQAIDRRQVTAAVPVLLENAKVREDDGLKAESYNVLAKMARAEDAKPLLEMNYAVASQRVRSKAELALLAAIRKMEPAESQSTFLVEAVGSAPSNEARVSILRLLGKLGDEKSYQELKKFVASDDKTIKDTAIRALADFPTAEPLHELLDIARDASAEKVHQVLALRGAARMLGLKPRLNRTEILGLAHTLQELANTDEDKKVVVSSLGDVKQPGILKLIEPALANEALAPEARAAILKLAPEVWKLEPSQTSATVSAINEADLNDDQKNELKKLADQMAAVATAIPGWQLNGPHSDPAVLDVAQLLDHKFEPETAGTDAVKWKSITCWTDKANPEVIDLAKALGEDSKNCVAYVRAFVTSEAETSATLRVGSDDGIRVWVNGQEVVSAPGPRSYKKAEDTANVTLTQGKNEVLAKVTQGDVAWRASVSLESADGAPLPGVVIQALPPNDKD